ncbi:syndetin isoform X4 [Lepidochelys kempii]|uniref:syndetin isoform X4 n=1 Tax=Lepidochelys kempii TaxID=8472 RepID=UPI003C6F30BF
MQKIKSLMTRQGLKSPQENVHDLSPVENFRIPSKEELRELREQPTDPQAQQEIINSIEEVYFSNDSFDIVKYELEKLPAVLSLQEMEEYRDKLKQQQAAVSKKVADLILEKQPAYVKELERVTSLQTGLQLAAVICTNGRRHLNIAKEGFTQASLGLLANQRKRQLLIGLLKSLRTIKTLQRTDVRLSEMLEEEDYPGAIQLCLECQKAASTFRHYSCISELNSKLQDTLEQIEEQLDVALSKICKNFDINHYTKVQQAYRLLGKTQTAMDQLHMHFTQAIHNTVFQVVLGYVELCAGNSDTKFQKLQYKDLCTHITSDSYIPCLADLCKALWEVMLSYYRTMEWHEKHDRDEGTASSSVSDGNNVIGAEETNFDHSYVQKKLEHGLSRIWQDVQLKVKTYLLGTDMSNFKYDDFIFVLDIISRLMQVGEEFCGSKSEVLQESIRKQSVNYFKNYHRTRLEELRMFLENETWELCPVKSSFSILQLHYESDEQEKSAYQEYDSDSDVPEELKRDYVDEQTGDAPVKSVSRETLRSRKRSDYNLNKVNAPILTNTTLNVIRLVGKYMQMMNILKPIAFDVIHFMSQLFDYYLYAVYTFFGRNDTPVQSSSLPTSSREQYSARQFESTGLGLSSSRLRTTLNRIQESLIDLEVSTDTTGTLTAAEERKEKVPSPHLSHLVVLTSGNTLYGLAERVVATESLVFLAEQFEFLQSHLDAVMPAAKKPFLQQFYSQTVSTASELRKPIYWIVAAKAIDYEQMLLLMANVKWDVKEIMSQHNIYVDTLLKEFEQFNRRLNEVSKRVRIPLPVSNILWEHCIRLANRTIVEGYANVKKCSNEGRALMQLDFQQFLMKLEKLTDIRPIPDKEFVETYIKAYYLTENDMERWIKEHREYSTKQLTNLVNVCLGSHINKKARQKLLAAIDDIDRPKR